MIPDTSAVGQLLLKIDDDLEKQLTSLAKIGLGFKPAVDRTHTSPRTVIRAAARQDKLDCLCKLFPASAKTIRREVDAEAKQAMQFKALSTPWRASELKDIARTS